MDVELRHFRCFLVIARELNITKAAAALHITQPALSRTLQQLEDLVGARLVDRTTRHLALTSEGEAFRIQAEHVLNAVDEAVTVAKRQLKPLRVGHSWSAIGEHTGRVVNEWNEAHPDQPVELRRIDERAAGVVRGLTDVAIIRGTVNEESLCMELLIEEPRFAAVPTNHELASRDSVHLADLAQSPVVNNAVSGTTTAALWRDTGATPSIIEVSNTDDWLMTIAAGRAVGVTPQSTSVMYSHPNVVYLPLVDAPPVPVWLAWRRDATHSAISDFVALAKHLIG